MRFFLFIIICKKYLKLYNINYIKIIKAENKFRFFCYCFLIKCVGSQSLNIGVSSHWIKGFA